VQLFTSPYDRSIEFLDLVLEEIKYYFNVFVVFWFFFLHQLNVGPKLLCVNFFTFLFIEVFFFYTAFSFIRYFIILQTSTKSIFNHFFAFHKSTLRFSSFVTAAIIFFKLQWRLRFQNFIIKIFQIILMKHYTYATFVFIFLLLSICFRHYLRLWGQKIIIWFKLILYFIRFS
jgi:hypothetical protein